MFSQNDFFDIGAFFALWALSVIGIIAVLPSWTSVEPEYEEGVLTRAGDLLVWARILLTVGCAVFWTCTLIGYILNGPNDLTFKFWLHHPAVLKVLFILVALMLIGSAVYAWQGRGARRWILSVAASVMAIATIFASSLLFIP